MSNNNLLNVAILCCKSSDEPDDLDTLLQINTVNKLLQQIGYKTSIVEIDGNQDYRWLEKLTKLQPDIVFNLVETVANSDANIYQITALLDYINIPYTGNNTLGFVLTGNKIYTKKTMLANNIKTPKWHLDDAVVFDEKQTQLDYIVKSQTEHGSVGIDSSSIVSIRDLPNIFAAKKLNYGGSWFAEEFIDGKEYNLSLLQIGKGVKVLPITNIIFEKNDKETPNIVDYNAKWIENSCSYKNSKERARVDFRSNRKLEQELHNIASACWEIFALRGYARIDFRIDKNNIPWLIDINANPCLSHDSGFIASAEMAGFAHHEIIDHIVKIGLTKL